MKKYLFPMTTSLIIGFLMAFFLINSYDNAKSVTLSKNAKKVYYIQRGVYTTKESMIDSMNDFEHYIYNVEDNRYYVYIGITKNKKNSYKLKDYYKSQGYDTYIKEKLTDNEQFLNILSQYDEILLKAADKETISVICNQV